MAASGAAGASTSTPAPPPPSTLARTSSPPSTLDASRISAPPSTLARTSSPPSTLDSSRGQVMDGGEPLMHTDGGGASLMRADDACVGRVGGQGIGEPEMRADDGGGDDPQMCGDGAGGKRQQTSQCKNTGGKDKQQKVDKANAKTNKKVLPLKVNEKKVDKANEKTEKQVGEAKLRSEKSRNKYGTASEGVPSPIQLTSSPGVNYIVRAATVKKEALKRANMGGSPSTSQRDLVRAATVKKEAVERANMGGSPSTPQRDLARAATVKKEALKRGNMRGSPSTPQRPSQNQLGSPSLQHLSPDTRATISQASKRKRRKLISEIRTEAEPIYNEEGKLVEGRCIHCHEKFAASRESGTSHMKRHLQVCEAKTSMNEMIAKMGHPGGLDPNWKYKPKVARRRLLMMIVMNDMPFSLVEYRQFREFTKALNPWFENISRTTIKTECVDAFKYHGGEMKEEFQSYSNRISLTGDMWTSNQKLGYFCLTAHFITDDWKLHKYIIRFVMMETPHNSVNMFNLVLKSLQEWNIEDKLFSFTLDNAAVNIAMVNSLRTNLKNKSSLVLGGKLLHFRCATHVFNLIVQDGLKVISSIVSNIRESVKYVRSSQSRVEKFDAMIIQEGLSAKHPCPDVTSRWNSTFLMLQTALPLRNAFLSLEIQDKEYTFSPLNSEWELAEAVMKVLEVFYTATNTLSGSKYPTSHLYFYQLWSIKNLLNREESILNRIFLKKDATGQDIKIAQMIEKMQAKFNQYWKETYMSACIPVVLDPRYKYDLLEYLLNDFGTEKEAHTWMGEVKKTMEELFSEYNKKFGEGESQRDTTTEEVQDDGDPLAGWDLYVRSKRRQSSNELEQYLKEQLTPRKEEIDILHWWKTKSELYPVLSRIARDVLAIPASTVPSESAFSTGGRVISDYRSSLKPTTVEALICLQDWFKAADARKNEE